MAESSIIIASSPKHDYVIVRKSILAETFAAYLLNKYFNAGIIQTDQITQMTLEMMERLLLVDIIKIMRRKY